MRYLSELYDGAHVFCQTPTDEFRFLFDAGRKVRVNILALGDVGGTLLMGLILLGGDCIESIGVFDQRPNAAERFETEMNQIAYPFAPYGFPETKVIDEEELFDCDVFIFCASKAVPEVGSSIDDVRIVQFEGNRKIIEYYGKRAGNEKYKGIFAVVSDPVDPLCKAVYLASGLSPFQIRGFGLGVMNGRAIYYAKKKTRYAKFLTEGRVFGPHGQGLVVADSIACYDASISDELTELVLTSNMKTRQMGFKPFMAPALSSGAISILLMLRGQWHYSSNFVGLEDNGAYLGANNRLVHGRVEVENLALPCELFEKIRYGYETLRKII